MSYKRIISEDLLQGEALTQSMIGVGMLFGGQGVRNPNIENTIFSATYCGIVNQDYRVLAMATLWIEKHAFILNASRLLKLIEESRESSELFRFWVVVAQWKKTDSRFQSLRKAIPIRDKSEISEGASFLAKRNGQDSRFEETCLVVPKKMLEKKEWLVLSPEQMVDHHLDYKWRLVIGPTFRADMWSKLEQDSSLSSAAIARESFGSYATAHRAKKEYKIFQQRVFKAE